MDRVFSAIYIEPGEAWDQGDIVDALYFSADDLEHPAVLVTPACDIAQEKTDLLTFVRLFDEAEVAHAVVAPELQGKSPAELTSKQRDSLRRRVRELVTQRLPRYHWLPPVRAGASGYVADFTWVTSVFAEEVRANSTRIARMVSSWREQLPARYASFMARVGTDDFVESVLDAHITDLFQRALTVAPAARSPAPE